MKEIDSLPRYFFRPKNGPYYSGPQHMNRRYSFFEMDRFEALDYQLISNDRGFIEKVHCQNIEKNLLGRNKVVRQITIHPIYGTYIFHRSLSFFTRGTIYLYNRFWKRKTCFFRVNNLCFQKNFKGIGFRKLFTTTKCY